MTHQCIYSHPRLFCWPGVRLYPVGDPSPSQALWIFVLDSPEDLAIGLALVFD
jgi:hypothetical protein